MDAEEDDFMGSPQSDYGGGTPVQDEHGPGSDGEEMRSSEPDQHNSEDEGSGDEAAAHAMDTTGVASGSEDERRGGADSDSEGEAPAHHSDSEPEPPRPADSDDDEVHSPPASPQRPASPSDNDEDRSSPINKGGASPTSDNDESPVKRRGSTSENDMSPAPPKRRGSSSDMEDGEARAARSDSEHEEEKRRPQSRQSDAGSDSDMETPRRKKKLESDDEGESKEEGQKEGKWKAAMQSDSEDEEEGVGKRKKAVDSDSDDEGKGKQAVGSDDEDGVGKHKQSVDSDDEDEGAKKRKQAVDSDSEDDDVGKRKQAGSDDESRPQRPASDSEDEDNVPVKRKKAILSDSEEDEDNDDKPAAKKSRAVSDDDNSDSDAGSEANDKTTAAKLRELGSDSEDDDDARKDTAGKKDEKALFGSDSEDGDAEEKMIADIFGDSGDEEEEEFTGFNQEDLEGEKKEEPESKKKPAQDDSDSDEGVERGNDTSFMSDFDVMLAKKKAQSGKRRRNRDGGTFISDADDVVSAMIVKMNEAAEEDRTLNSQKKPALKKLTLLPTVVTHLKKQDLKETFIDSGVMSAIKEWISPLPDKSLPALRIREELLRVLQELPSVSQETLKHSGIGRSVMFLYKHPKESRPNKDLAMKLINEWSRPIFGLTSNYKGMTREERQQRDLDQQMPQRRRLSSGGQTPRRDLEKVLTGEEKALRPGDPGFCARARVPMPSNKDYVVRPKWNVDQESNRQAPVRKGTSRVDKQMRRFADIKRLTKIGHAVKISVQGNKMPL